jgi:hypothetical protein
MQRTTDPRGLPLLVLAVSAALSVLAYGRILGFPYLFDDPIHLRWLEGRDLVDIWSDAEGMQHYRPLVFSIWHLVSNRLGTGAVAPLHLLSLLLHIANGSLVGWLVYRVSTTRSASARSVVAPVAAALFVAFPFSYQVLPSPGSQS